MPAETKTKSDGAVIVERTYRSAPDRVWSAWSDPKQLEKWFFPLDNPGARVPVFDVRVGGAFRVEFQGGPEGMPVTAVGSFKEVVPGKRMVFSWDWEGQPPMQGSMVTVDFEKVVSGTKVTLTHRGLPPGEPSAMHEHGWKGIMDRFAAQERPTPE